MKTKVYLGIALRIILLFGVAFFGTYLHDLLLDYFGDEWVRTEIQDYDHKTPPEYEMVLEWGARHYWYIACIATLFALTLINCIMSIAGIINKNYTVNM